MITTYTDNRDLFEVGQSVMNIFEALIAATKDSISPKPKDLKALMFVCKNRYHGLHFVNG